jgi:hypothetical protein
MSWGCRSPSKGILYPGYIMSVHEELVPEIPGLKIETWGTLRVFLDGPF